MNHYKSHLCIAKRRLAHWLVKPYSSMYDPFQVKCKHKNHIPLHSLLAVERTLYQKVSLNSNCMTADNPFMIWARMWTRCLRVNLDLQSHHWKVSASCCIAAFSSGFPSVCLTKTTKQYRTHPSLSQHLLLFPEDMVYYATVPFLPLVEVGRISVFVCDTQFY